MQGTNDQNRGRFVRRASLALVGFALLAAFAPLASSMAASTQAAAAPVAADIVVGTPAIALRVSYAGVVAQAPAPWQIVTTTSPEFLRPHFGAAVAPTASQIVS